MYVIDNTFTVTFTNATAAEKAKAIAKNCISKSIKDFYNEKPEIPAFYIEQDTILTFEDPCLLSEDLLEATKDAVLAIAQEMKNENYSFSASGSDTYNSINIEGKYKKGVLRLTSVLYEESERKVKNKERIRVY